MLSAFEDVRRVVSRVGTGPIGPGRLQNDSFAAFYECFEDETNPHPTTGGVGGKIIHNNYFAGLLCRKVQKFRSGNFVLVSTHSWRWHCTQRQ
jgi:hypothetical protein